MSRAILLILVSLALPISAALPFGSSVAEAAPASTFFGARALLVASSSPSNAYVAGATVTVTGATRGDLSALGGSVVVAAPVSGDLLVAAGTASLRDTIAGDLRAVAGSLSVLGPVKGDLVALGGSVSASGPVSGSVFIMGATVALTGGASGPVLIYANSVSLGGNFSGDVTVVAGGTLSLVPGTTIKGTLSYQAAEPASIPSDASIGAVKYTGSSYLPTTESHALAFAGFGIFLLVQILAALLLAGLLAGLFPRLAELVTARAERGSVRSVLLTALLGFAALVATPVLLILLSLSFIGLAVALLIGIAYILLLLLAFVYAGILIGGLIAWRFSHRETIIWRDGVLGMFVLSLALLVPILGGILVLLLAAFAAGALLLFFFRFAFPHDAETREML